MPVKAISPNDVYRLHQESGIIVVVDVRERSEFSEVRAPMAKNFPLSEFNVREVTDGIGSKSQIFVICRSGRRSLKAAEILESAGFECVYNVEGGMIDWEATGLPVLR